MTLRMTGNAETWTRTYFKEAPPVLKAFLLDKIMDQFHDEAIQDEWDLFVYLTQWAKEWEAMS